MLYLFLQTYRSLLNRLTFLTMRTTKFLSPQYQVHGLNKFSLGNVHLKRKKEEKVKRHSKVVLKKGKKGPIDPKRNDRPPSPLGVRRAIRVRRHLPWLWHDSSSFHPWSFDRISQSPHCMYLHHLTRKKDLKTLWNLPWERVFFGHYEHFWNWCGKVINSKF